jgi:HlyD family secretion protein
VREKKQLEKKADVEEPADSPSSEEGRKQDMVEVVFCVENNKAVSKPVKLGISDDTHYEILSGVEEGEEVITGPFRVLSRTLKDGDLIEYEKKEKEIKNAD